MQQAVPDMLICQVRNRLLSRNGEIREALTSCTVHHCARADQGLCERRAASAVDLTASRGEVFGFVGLNGAGKAAFCECHSCLARSSLYWFFRLSGDC